MSEEGMALSAQAGMQTCSFSPRQSEALRFSTLVPVIYCSSGPVSPPLGLRSDLGSAFPSVEKLKEQQLLACFVSQPPLCMGSTVALVDCDLLSPSSNCTLGYPHSSLPHCSGMRHSACMGRDYWPHTERTMSPCPRDSAVKTDGSAAGGGV